MTEFLNILIPSYDPAGPGIVTIVLIDLFVIVILARILGNLFNRIGQPRVVGEITAGLLLGPTLLGNDLSLLIFPEYARSIHNIFAALGLALFMFLIGVEFDFKNTQGQLGLATVLAGLAIIVPVFMSIPLALLMVSPDYMGTAAPGFLPYALFIGAAISVTAFPIMAYILMERGELNSTLGSLGVASAGIMSVVMFTYISFVSAIVSAKGSTELLFRIMLVFAFILLSWFLVRPLLRKLINGDRITGNGLAICLGGLALYAAISHQIGIHVMVGGFLWGLIIPDNRSLRSSLVPPLKEFTTVFLLPIFFAMAGFQADFRLLTAATLPIIALVLLVAIVSKFLAVFPARLKGLSWGDTIVLGALFNTRGLLVIVVGLIGLQLDVITNLTFTVFIVVALITNLMTVPSLNFVSHRRSAGNPVPPVLQSSDEPISIEVDA